MRRRWRDRVRAVGEALVEVLKAELEALSGDLRANTRGLVVAIVFFLAALCGFFWWCGLLIFGLVTVAALWLPLWQAVALVWFLCTLVSTLLYFLGQRKLKQLESPGATVRRHLDDHLRWWQTRFLPPQEAKPALRQPVEEAVEEKADE